MKYQEIGYKQFIEIIKLNKSTFLTGNGFSINFDQGYTLKALTKRLWDTHGHIQNYRNYDVLSNKRYKYVYENNFKCAYNELKELNEEKDFIKLFVDGVEFARSLINNKKAISWLDENEYKNDLTFGLKRIDLVYDLVKQADRYGELYVNYELWSILIYYILALDEAPYTVYNADESNLFVGTVLIGSTNKFDVTSNRTIPLNVACNGMYTYLRFLFTSNILMQGKSYNVTELDNWMTYDMRKIREFLCNFQYLVTTNYDLILEGITGRKVEHLHGCFDRKKNRVLSESLGISYQGIRYDLTTTMIGDYFLAKTFLPIVVGMGAKQSQNTSVEMFHKILPRIINDEQSNVVVIYGLNIENDYHLLRNIQINMGTNLMINNHIIYCYYNENDKDTFLDMCEKCLTYSSDLINAINNNIVVSIMDSKEIAKEIFEQL